MRTHLGSCRFSVTIIDSFNDTVVLRKTVVIGWGRAVAPAVAAPDNSAPDCIESVEDSGKHRVV